MTKRTQEELHPDIEKARGEFERWRRERTKLGRMPGELWEESVRLARHHGVHTVAQALGLHYTRLKEAVWGEQEEAESAGTSLSPVGDATTGKHPFEFVELRPVAPVSLPDQGEATIEVTRADGSKLTIRLPTGGQGGDRLDLVAMTQAFLESGA